MTAPSPSASGRQISSRWPLVAGLAAIVIGLTFAAFTRHMWEDYLITFRSSQNLATGQGLVFQPGERVHTFTSPLGTLLPALFARTPGTDAAVPALWWFRVVSVVALGAALWLAVQAMIRDTLVPLAAASASAAWLLDPKTVDFSISGMETAWLVFFVVVTWRALTDGARLLPIALGLAGLQWTRPDGCVFFGALAGAWLVCGGADGSRVARLRALVPGIAVAALCYLPWALFAWRYYGSPIPHTILAKASPLASNNVPLELALYPVRLLGGHAALHHLFMPAYAFFGGWPDALWWLSRLIVVGAALAWLLPGMRTAGRVASCAFFLGGFYVEIIPRSPWYYPGWQAMAFIAWAYLLDAALRSVWGSGKLASTARFLGRAAALAIVALQATLFVGVAWEMHAQQAIIEDGNRREIGRWLRTQAAPGDRVYLEPLGYIGYFSGLKMLDFPGLSSPEVVASVRAGHRPHAGIIADLRPEWLVLRPHEVAGVLADLPRLLPDNYRLMRVFDVQAQVDAVSVLPGREYLDFDARYLVFRRVNAAATTP